MTEARKGATAASAALLCDKCTRIEYDPPDITWKAINADHMAVRMRSLPFGDIVQPNYRPHYVLHLRHDWDAVLICFRVNSVILLSKIMLKTFIENTNTSDNDRK